MSQKLPAIGFNWVEKHPNLMKISEKCIMKIAI